MDNKKYTLLWEHRNGNIERFELEEYNVLGSSSKHEITLSSHLASDAGNFILRIKNNRLLCHPLNNAMVNGEICKRKMKPLELFEGDELCLCGIVENEFVVTNWWFRIEVNFARKREYSFQDVLTIKKRATSITTQEESIKDLIDNNKTITHPEVQERNSNNDKNLSKDNDEQSLLHILNSVYHFKDFRALQKEVIESAVLNKNIVNIMPTAGGKSLCMIMPSQIQKKITIIFMPLTTLIEQQKQKMINLGIKVMAFVNVDAAESKKMIAELQSIRNDTWTVLMTPERAHSETIIDDVENMCRLGVIGRFCVDEAHKLTEWGTTFRISYSWLQHLRQTFKSIPWTFSTGTANPNFVPLQRYLFKLDDLIEYRLPIVRDNIQLNVLKYTTDKAVINTIEYILKKYLLPGKSEIIYCLKKQNTEIVAKQLIELKISAKAFHAGLDPKLKTEIFNEWINGSVNVLISTTAIGMGVDNPNADVIIHLYPGFNIEAMYQEICRCARSGGIGYSFIFFNDFLLEQTRQILQENSSDKQLSESQEEQCNLLHNYLKNKGDCRAMLLAQYFNERVEGSCRQRTPNLLCDNCVMNDALKIEDVSDLAKQLCRRIYEINQKSSTTTATLPIILSSFSNRPIDDKIRHLPTLERLILYLQQLGIIEREICYRNKSMQTFYVVLSFKFPLIQWPILPLKDRFL